MTIRETYTKSRYPRGARQAAAGCLPPLKALLTATLLLLSVFVPITSQAQAEMIFTQHWALPTLYNPARTGDTDFLRISGGARLQWIGVHNAPKSFTAAGDMPFAIGKKRIGAGVTFSQESLGLFSNLLVSAQGSYRFKILGGVLAAGLQVGYYNSRFRGSEVYIPGDDDYHQPADPSIPTQDLSGNAVDFSIGANFTHRLFHAGLAVAHVTSPTVTLQREGSESNESQRYETNLPRTLYFDAGGNIPLENTLFQLQPSLLAASDFKTFSAEIAVTAKYNNFISAGLGYRWKDAVSIMIGAEFKNFFLGYAFDYPTSAISRASSGSHEIVAGYRLKLDLSGKNKNRHRSIRIM